MAVGKSPSHFLLNVSATGCWGKLWMVAMIGTRFRLVRKAYFDFSRIISVSATRAGPMVFSD